jgi:hypothetical protein
VTRPAGDLYSREALIAERQFDRQRSATPRGTLTRTRIYLSRPTLAITDTAIDATLRLAASGEHAGFARLIAAHHASMARVANAITGDRDSAADAVQGAWAIAWARFGSMRNPGTVHFQVLAPIR